MPGVANVLLICAPRLVVARCRGWCRSRLSDVVQVTLVIVISIVACRVGYVFGPF